MFGIERHNQIIAYLEKHDIASVQELSEKLFASPSTIRRDLSLLQEQGIVLRLHGGAVLASGSNYDAPSMLRRQQALAEKQRIAELASQFLQPSSSYFFDSSTTSAVLAEKLENYPNTRILTNGMEIPNRMNNSENVSIISCGGQLCPPWSEFTGNISIHAIEAMNADVFFLSCGAFNLEQGGTEFREENVAVKRAFLKNSRKHILLCDRSKFDDVLFYNSVAIEELDYIVTDGRPPERYVEILGDKLIF
jgi:DeoR/GlpR family transcriptional regulator of sugar metabolism